MNGLMGYQQVFVNHGIITSTGNKKIKVFAEDLIYLAVKNAIFFKNISRRIPVRRRKMDKRSWHQAGWLSFGFLGVRVKKERM
jgi:hypothetical protein